MKTKQIVKRTITDFLQHEYQDFSKYTVAERAIPHFCDGLKPGARKIVHAACVGSLRNGSTNKLLALSGDTMKLSLYAHGDSSLNGTICTLARGFSNNFNPLEIDGQGGTLRDPDAGSPRYLYIRHSKYMEMVYKTDYDLLNFIQEEGQSVEPQHYLPIIPVVLCNMTMGIANGYSFHSMAYHPIDVIDACIERLKSPKKQITTIIRPYLRDIKQSNFRFEDDQWVNYGEWKVNQSKDLITVTDLPYDVTYEDFEKTLGKLQEKGWLKDYKNKSEDGKVLYEILFSRGELAKECKRDRSGKRIAQQLKLIKILPDDLLWLLDENDNLKLYQGKYDVVYKFVDWRLTIYTERKKRLVKILSERIDKNDLLVKFITLVCNGKLKIRNRSKADIKVDMDKEKLPMELLSTPMSKVTIEERDELLKQNEAMKKELEYIRKTTEQKMYLNDLQSLRENIEKDFK